MNTKKIILILLLIFSISFVLTGCSAIGELKTETILNDYLEEDNGPESVINQSFDKLMDELNNNNDETLNDYNWSSSISLYEINIVNSKADDNGSGILTAKDIVLIYNYQITGKAEGLEPIKKSGTLEYNIGSLTYDDNKNELTGMSNTQADTNGTPSISEVQTNNDYFSLNAKIIDHNFETTLGVISLGNRIFSDDLNNQVLEISTNQLELDTELELGETDFASILVIDYDELLNEKSEKTGLAAMLIAVPKN